MSNHNVISRKSAKELGLKRYFTGIECKRGHKAERIVSSKACLGCINERQSMPEIKEKLNKAMREHYIKNKEYYQINSKEWREKNKESIRARTVKWVEDNRELVRAYRRKYYHNHKAKFELQSIQRRDHIKRQKIALHYSQEIYEIYKNKPDGCHVDHIIPLRGKLVSGLHVPWNMQYLKAEDNIKKGNRYAVL